MELNYLKIYEIIAKYYPIGISSFNKIYQEYSGSILLQEICYEKMGSLPYKKWRLLLKEFKDENPDILKSDSESFLPFPCYSGKLLLHRENKGSVVYTREINFHLSLIGPFYTIYGLDRVQLNSGTDKSRFFEPMLYYSPIDIYQLYYPLIRDKITKKYSGYTFIPYPLLSKRVDSLFVSGANIKTGQNASVFQALFTFDDVTNYVSVGDIWYE